MKLGPQGKILIKHFESCKLKSYQDAAGVWTVGWGNTTYEDGSKVKPSDVISQTRADDLFENSLCRYEKEVLEKTTRPLLQQEFDALISFTYNAWSGSKGVDYNLWKHVNNKLGKDGMQKYWETLAVTSGGKKLNGLARRRKAEVHLYLYGTLKFY